MTAAQPDPTKTTNPYTPTVSSSGLEERLSHELVDSTADVYQPASLGLTALRWFSICFVSAIPSFLLGMGVTDYRVTGMIVGILIFTVGYTLADYLTRHQPWREQKLIRQTLKLTYGTRIAITLLFPIGYRLDLFCGSIAISATEAFTGQQFMSGDEQMLLATIVTCTLIQGAIMNGVLAVYGLLVLALLGTIEWTRG